MALMERIKDAVGMTEPEVTYYYHCRECDETFDAAEDSRAQVACPNCGATGTTNITRM